LTRQSQRDDEAAVSGEAKVMIRIDYDAEDVMRIADDDGGTASDYDLCDRCECCRSEHEDGAGRCSCGGCRKFKEVT
jgi:hypothetical protein